MFFLDAAILVCVRPPIDFGAVARLVAPTARRGAGRPAARSTGFFAFAFDFDVACFDEDFEAFDVFAAFDLPAGFDFITGFDRVELFDTPAFAFLRAPDVLRVAPALAARDARSIVEAVRRTPAASRSAMRFAVAPPGMPARFAARSVFRPLRLSIVLVCAAARLAPVRAADPARAAALPAAPAVVESVLAARPSIDPTASAPRSTSVIVVSAACESGSPGRVVLLSAIRRTSKQQRPSRRVPAACLYRPWICGILSFGSRGSISSRMAT